MVLEKKSFETRSNCCLYLATQKLLIIKDFRYFSDQPTFGFIRPPCLLLEPPDQRSDIPAENYDDAEEVPVPGAPPSSQGREEKVPSEKEDGVRSSQKGEWGQLISCNLSIWEG